MSKKLIYIKKRIYASDPLAIAAHRVSPNIIGLTPEFLIFVMVIVEPIKNKHNTNRRPDSLKIT
jgi:hypothetical protein